MLPGLLTTILVTLTTYFKPENVFSNWDELLYSIFVRVQSTLYYNWLLFCQLQSSSITVGCTLTYVKNYIYIRI